MMYFSAQEHSSTNIPHRELQETINVLSPTSFEITTNPLVRILRTIVQLIENEVFF